MVTLRMDVMKRPLFLILHPRYVETILDEKNQSLINHTKPSVCRFFQIHVNHQRRVTMPQKNQRQLPPSNTNHNTTSKT